MIRATNHPPVFLSRNNLCSAHPVLLAQILQRRCGQLQPFLGQGRLFHGHRRPLRHWRLLPLPRKSRKKARMSWTRLRLRLRFRLKHLLPLQRISSLRTSRTSRPPSGSFLKEAQRRHHHSSSTINSAPLTRLPTQHPWTPRHVRRQPPPPTPTPPSQHPRSPPWDTFRTTHP